MKKLFLMPIVLDLFTAYDGGADGAYGIVPNTNTTGDAGMSVEMKTYYSDYLIDLAEPELVHDQFGQKHPIPKNGGKTIEFRQYDPLPEMTTPLTEGVTPDGQSLSVKNITATVGQYGGYVTLSDMLILTAIDNNLVQATKLIGSQAGRTLDTLTRETLNASTNVYYGGSAESREEVSYTDATTNSNLTVDLVKKVVRYLESVSAPKINGYYVGIIHPYVKYDLMKDPLWKNPHEYVDTENIYQNEIGELYGVRFVESPRAKKWEATPLTANAKTLTVASAVTADDDVPVEEAIAATDFINTLSGTNKKVLINGTEHTFASVTTGAAGSAKIVLSATATIAKGAKISFIDGGKDGIDVYSTLIMGADAYGVTEVSGGGLEHITKQLGAGGTSDPLNQRATCGWKATKVAEVLIPEYLVRVETSATP